jgi:hypothetical protein
MRPHWRKSSACKPWLPERRDLSGAAPFGERAQPFLRFVTGSDGGEVFDGTQNAAPIVEVDLA